MDAVVYPLILLTLTATSSFLRGFPRTFSSPVRNT